MGDIVIEIQVDDPVLLELETHEVFINPNPVPPEEPLFTSWLATMFTAGEKKTGVDAGVLHQRSLTDDYEYVCVKGGAAGVAIWKKIVLFAT